MAKLIFLFCKFVSQVMSNMVQPTSKIPVIKASRFTEVCRDLAAHFNEFFDEHGDIIRLSKSQKVFVISSPEAVQHISKKNMDNYDKEFQIYQRLGETFGRGVLTMVGKPWWHRRKLLQPFFTHKKMEEVAKVSAEKTEQMLERWKKFAKTKEPFDLTTELLACVLQTSLQILFSEDISFKQANKITSCYTACQKAVHHSWILKPWFPSYSNYIFYKNQRKIMRYCKRLLKKRSKKTNPPNDLLNTILTGIDESTGKPLTDKDVLAEMRTFIATGHETTGHALGWIFSLLMQNRGCEQQLEQELSSVLDGRAPSYEDLKQLPYNLMVVKEGLRFYPTIWSFGRRALDKDVLCGYEIPKDSTIIICPYAFHRLNQYWQQPYEFNPLRFSEPNPEPSHRYAYFPFGLGSHMCIANQFSMVQLQVMLATIKQRVKFRRMTDEDAYELLFTIKPKHPLFVRIEMVS